MAHLHNPSDSGEKFAEALTFFCKEFSPTIQELRRLLSVSLGANDWHRVVECQQQTASRNIQTGIMARMRADRKGCYICKSDDHDVRACKKCRLCKEEGHWFAIRPCDLQCLQRLYCDSYIYYVTNMS